jgi:hypothetical protein
MPKRKSISYLIAVFVAVGMLTSIGYRYWTRGVYINITNTTQNVLKDINIAYTGGVIHIANLESKTSYGQYINPTSESHLELEWLDSSGAKQSQEIGVYFEHNYAGSIEITIDPNNIVSWSHKHSKKFGIFF